MVGGATLSVSRAVANGMDASCSGSGGRRWWSGDAVAEGSHVGTNISSLAMSHVTLDAMQNLGGVAAAPKGRHNRRLVMWPRRHMQLAVDFQQVWIHCYAESNENWCGWKYDGVGNGGNGGNGGKWRQWLQVHNANAVLSVWSWHAQYLLMISPRVEIVNCFASPMGQSLGPIMWLM